MNSGMNMFTNPNTGFAFPSMDVREKQKDAEWHKQFALAAVRDSQAYSDEYTAIDRAFRLFTNRYIGEEFSFLQRSEDGAALPAEWVDTNRINPKVKNLVGTLLQSPGEFYVNALNKDAVSQKLDKRMEVLAKMDLRPIFERIQQGTGMQLADDTVELVPGIGQKFPMPKDNDELDILMSEGYKGLSEICMKRVVDMFAKRMGWDWKRSEFFMYIPLAARCIGKLVWENGYPILEKVDPRYFFFDHLATDCFLSDAGYMGSFRYLPEALVLARYNITPGELEEIGRQGLGAYGVSPLPWPMARQINSRMHYLVYTVEFTDTKPVRTNEYEDKEGRMRYYETKTGDKYEPDSTLPKEYKMEEDGVYSRPEKNSRIYSKRKRTVRFVTMVGTKVLEFGELANQVRSCDDYTMLGSGYSYKCFFPGWVDSSNVSMTTLMEGFEKLRKAALYNLQLAMNRAGAKVIYYDATKKPQKMEWTQVMHHLKATGFLPYEGTGELPMNDRGGPGIGVLDLTVGPLGEYLQVMDFLDRQEDIVTGINEARQGVIQNSSQAVGLTRTAIAQSNLQTLDLYTGFQMWEEMVFTDIVNAFKVGTTRKEVIDRYSHILGDVAMAFIKSDADLALDDYGVYIEKMPDIVSDPQMFSQVVMQCVQTGQIDMADALELLQMRDIKMAQRKLRMEIKRKQREEREHQLAMAQEANAAQLGQAQMQAQGALGVAAMNNQGKLAATQMQVAGQERMGHANNMANLTGRQMDISAQPPVPPPQIPNG